MPSKKSGGERAVEKKHLARQAARDRSPAWSDTWRARYAKLGEPPIGKPEAAHQWLADMTLTAMAESADDPGMPPEQRREQIGRLAAQAAKVIDPAKLSAKLAQYERALEELHANASQVSAGQDGSARPPSTLS